MNEEEKLTLLIMFGMLSGLAFSVWEWLKL